MCHFNLHPLIEVVRPCMAFRVLAALWLVLAVACLPAMAQVRHRPPRRAVIEWTDAEYQSTHRMQLQYLGIGNLTALLDELLPDTAALRAVAASPDEVSRLIEDLGADSFHVREAASRRLTELGQGIRRSLVEAAKSPVAERSWRATRILRNWEERKFEDKSRYLPAFAAYCEGITEGPRLEEIGRRTRAALQNDVVNESRREVLRQCMVVLIRSGKEEYDALLRPYLKHDDMTLAMLVVEAAGQSMESGRGRPMPKLLLDALRSDREDLVVIAINYTINCSPTARSEDLKKTLIELFGGSRDSLKFQAAYPLMRLYNHLPAIDYVLEQARGDDSGRRCNALAWLMAEDNKAKEPDSRVMETIVSLLQHEDPQTRRMAAVSLSSFSGETIVRHLIPMLGDKDVNVAADVGNRLLGQTDKALLRKLLEAAAKDDTKKAVRRMAKQTLEQLDQLERDQREEEADQQEFLEIDGTWDILPAG